NPKLAFVPCLYFRDYTPDFWKNYGALFDGVLFPYLAESSHPNLTDATLAEAEIEKIKSVIGEKVPVILDIYATPYNSLPICSRPQYIRDCMERGHRAGAGVLIYCHQGKTQSPEKFAVIKEKFNQWADEPKK